MAGYLGRPPQAWILPVTKGCDRTFTVRRKDAQGELVDWDAIVYINIDINKLEPTMIAASVVGAVATFHIDSDICDQVKNSTRWRIVMSAAQGNFQVETPLAVGTFERHDG